MILREKPSLVSYCAVSYARYIDWDVVSCSPIEDGAFIAYAFSNFMAKLPRRDFFHSLSPEALQQNAHLFLNYYAVAVVRHENVSQSIDVFIPKFGIVHEKRP